MGGLVARKSARRGEKNENLLGLDAQVAIERVATTKNWAAAMTRFNEFGRVAQSL
jgi:hypothetical protein